MGPKTGREEGTKMAEERETDKVRVTACLVDAGPPCAEAKLAAKHRDRMRKVQDELEKEWKKGG